MGGNSLHTQTRRGFKWQREPENSLFLSATKMSRQGLKPSKKVEARIGSSRTGLAI